MRVAREPAMRNLALKEKLSFVAVGGSAALCYFVFALALSGMGLNSTAASIAAYLACIPPTYVAQRWITFQSTRQHTTAFTRYVALQAFGLVTTTATVALVARLGAPPLIAFVVAVTLASTLSYLLQKRWVH